METGQDNRDIRDEKLNDILVMLASRGWQCVKEEVDRYKEMFLNSTEDNVVDNLRKYKTIKDFIATIEDNLNN